MLDWFYRHGYRYIIRDMDSTLYVSSGRPLFFEQAYTQDVFYLGQLPIFSDVQIGEKRDILEYMKSCQNHT